MSAEFKTMAEVLAAGRGLIQKRAAETQLEWPDAAALARAGARMLERRYLPYDPEAFEALAAYYALSSAQRRHGLLLSGGVGTGKTYFVRQVLDWTLLPARKALDAYRDADGLLGPVFWFHAVRAWNEDPLRYLCLDDLGDEPLSVHFGQAEELLAQVIQLRYRDWQARGCLTAVTTNLSLGQIGARYGERVLDRLREMCVVVELKGSSVRA